MRCPPRMISLTGGWSTSFISVARASVSSSAPFTSMYPSRISFCNATSFGSSPNFPAFHAEAARLRELGYEVLSPAELNEAFPNESYEWYIARDIIELGKCDAIVFMEGYSRSTGCQIERLIAQKKGIPEFFSWICHNLTETGSL